MFSHVDFAFESETFSGHLASLRNMWYLHMSDDLDRLMMIVGSEFVRKRQVERIVPVLQIFEIIKIQLSLYA